MNSKKIIVISTIPLVSLILVISITLVAEQYGWLTTFPAQKANQTLPLPGSCKILEERYCSTATLIEWNFQGKVFKLVGFRLPKGTPIFAHKSGQATRVEINQAASLKGFQTTISDPNSESSGSVFITGDLEFDKQSTMNVQEGTVIGRVGNRGITPIPNVSDYNIVIRVGRYDPILGKAVSADDVLRELFPLSFNNQ